MSILYKPKHVISFGNSIELNSDYFDIYSIATQNLFNNALFQIEIHKIIKPLNDNLFDIEKLFNDIIYDKENYYESLINLLDIKKISIHDFNITFHVDINYFIIWPEQAELHLLNNEKDDLGVKDILTYDEFVIKKLLE